MPPGKRWDKRLRERRVYVSHAAGLTPEEIGRNLRLNPKTVRQILARAGVDVARESVSKREERKQMSKKQVSREEFLELQERVKDNTRMMIERSLEDASTSGEIARRAKERGISHGDALVQFAEELEAPYKKIELEAEEKRLEREYQQALGYDPRTPVVSPEDEARACGVHPSEVRSCAKRHGLNPLDAVITLAEERTPEPKAEEPTVVNLAPLEREEERIHKRAEDWARREGCSFEIALEAVLNEEVA